MSENHFLPRFTSPQLEISVAMPLEFKCTHCVTLNIHLCYCDRLRAEHLDKPTERLLISYLTFSSLCVVFQEGLPTTWASEWNSLWQTPANFRKNTHGKTSFTPQQQHKHSEMRLIWKDVKLDFCFDPQSLIYRSIFGFTYQIFIYGFAFPLGIVCVT